MNAMNAMSDRNQCIQSIQTFVCDWRLILFLSAIIAYNNEIEDKI